GHIAAAKTAAAISRISSHAIPHQRTDITIVSHSESYFKEVLVVRVLEPAANGLPYMLKVGIKGVRIILRSDHFGRMLSGYGIVIAPILRTPHVITIHFRDGGVPFGCRVGKLVGIPQRPSTRKQRNPSQ